MNAIRSYLPRVVVLNDWPPGYYAEVPQALESLAGRAEVAIYERPAASADELADWLIGAYAAIDIRARSTFDATLLCVNITPFGAPVVPDV